MYEFDKPLDYYLKIYEKQKNKIFPTKSTMFKPEYQEIIYSTDGISNYYNNKDYLKRISYVIKDKDKKIKYFKVPESIPTGFITYNKSEISDISLKDAILEITQLLDKPINQLIYITYTNSNGFFTINPFTIYNNNKIKIQNLIMYNNNVRILEFKCYWNNDNPTMSISFYNELSYIINYNKLFITFKDIISDLKIYISFDGLTYETLTANITNYEIHTDSQYFQEIVETTTIGLPYSLKIFKPYIKNVDDYIETYDSDLNNFNYIKSHENKDLYDKKIINKTSSYISTAQSYYNYLNRVYPGKYPPPDYNINNLLSIFPTISKIELERNYLYYYYKTIGIDIDTSQNLH